jgi:hypothetical protein
MEYLAVQWKHSLPDMPIEIFSEIDQQRMEIRKVEIFRNGEFGFASSAATRGPTKLGIEPLPPFEEIKSQPEFSPRRISREEFEAMWSKASGKVSAR